MTAFAPQTAADGSSHRLQHIREIKQQLENEREKRVGLYKKYRRAANTVDSDDTTLLMLLRPCRVELSAVAENSSLAGWL